MKTIITFLSIIASCSLAADVTPPKVNLVAKLAKMNMHVYPMAPEIAIGGKLIKRIEFGKASVLLSFHNATNESLQPNYTILIINGYGMEISRVESKWILDSVPAGGIAKDDKMFVVGSGIKDMLRFSDVTLPADWETPAYIVILGADP